MTTLSEEVFKDENSLREAMKKNRSGLSVSEIEKIKENINPKILEMKDNPWNS